MLYKRIEHKSKKFRDSSIRSEKKPLCLKVISLATNDK